LKPVHDIACPIVARHPLTGGCGLKLDVDVVLVVGSKSPPHGGVWIETSARGGKIGCCHVTPSRGGVD